MEAKIESPVDIETYTNSKEATLFMIDVSESMLTHDTENASHHRVRDAIECCYQFLLQKIIASPHDMVGILLYGTSLSQSPEEYSYVACKNAIVLMDLACPDAKPMKIIKRLLVDDFDCRKDFAPSADRPQLTNVLFFVNGIFSQRAPNFTQKRIILFTDDDDPHVGNAASSKAAITRARDLSDLGISIEPVFFCRPGATFDISKFWDEIISRHDVTSDANLVHSASNGSNHADLLRIVRHKAFPRRAIFTVPLSLTDSLDIGVKGYIVYKEQKISKTTWIYNQGDRPQAVKPETTYICADTTRTLQRSDIKRGYKLGSEIVQFSEEEYASLRRFGNPVIRIIGYKSIDKLQIWCSMKPAYFIYPTEESVTGSTRVFSCLHFAMLRRKKLALAWFIPRKNAAPVMCAIVATRKVDSTSKPDYQISPAGLFLITLPFADDIRQNPPQKCIRASSDVVDAMSAVVQSLRLENFDPHRYTNPVLRWHWQTLQAMALEEDMPLHEPDDTLPKYKGIAKRASSLITKWQSKLDEASATNLEPASQNKRKASMDQSKAKKSHKSSTDEYPTLEELTTMKKDGSLSKCNVATLNTIISQWFGDEPTRPLSKRKTDLLTYICDRV